MITDTMDNDDVFSDTQTPAESVVTNPVQEWTVDEVCSWLTTEGMGQYAQIFCSQAIDGRELLTLTPTTLQHDLAIGLWIFKYNLNLAPLNTATVILNPFYYPIKSVIGNV